MRYWPYTAPSGSYPTGVRPCWPRAPRSPRSVCSHCHPFYTGEQRIVDTAGQVDRFMKRLQTSQSQQAEAARRRDEKNQPPSKKPSLLQEIYGDEA